MTDGIHFIRDLMVVLLAATAGGFAARRLGLSPVVGYLAAGLIIGSPQVEFIYVTDPARVQALSQVGLVLLMFAIGTGMRLRQVGELGIGPVVATVLTALLMLTLGRASGSLLGLTRVEGLFFASMLMVSSSAIIGKVLAERRRLHQRVGQMALSQTLLEDFVAVVMLAILGSVAAFGQPGAGGGAGLAAGLAKLGGFVLLVLLTGLILLPRIISKVHEHAGEEMQILLAAGLVFAFALLSVMAGYSLALGAFLFGMLVAESAHMHMISRAFSGMRDIFTAVFFAAIGMGIDLAQMPAALDLILWGSALAIAGRAVCAAAAWMAACERLPAAVAAALHLTPIGEFSFIIAGFGVASGVVPERFQSAAVGIAFVTSLLAPALMGQADRASRLAQRCEGGRASEMMDAYRAIWARFRDRGRDHLLWRFLKKRLWQIGREVAWVAAVIVFAQPLYAALARVSGTRAPWLAEFLPWFWLAVFVVLLVPGVSVIRNIQAVSMILVDYYARQSPRIAKFRKAWTFLIQAICLFVLLLLFGNFMPWWLFDRWTIAALLGVTVLVMLLGWNRLIRLHSQTEVILRDAFAQPPTPLQDEWETAGRDWGLVLEEFVVPAEFRQAGRSIGELGLRQRTGATIIGIERQGLHLAQPGPASHIFPADRLFLIGRQDQVAAAVDILSETAVTPVPDGRDLSHAILETVRVPPGSSVLGRRLEELNWPRLFGVQVVAVRVADATNYSPGPDWLLTEGTELLLAGGAKSIAEVKRRLG